MRARKTGSGSRKRVLGFERTLGQERGFTVVELGVVIMIIGIMLGAAVVSYYNASRTTEVMTVAEQIKQEIRRVYAMTDSQEKANGYKVRYRITFNNSSGTPPNAYMIEKGTTTDNWVNVANETWTPVTPSKSTSYKIVSTNWIQPATQSDCQLSSSTPTITFKSMGSIMMTNPEADNWVRVSSYSQNSKVTIVVNSMGSVDNQ